MEDSELSICYTHMRATYIRIGDRVRPLIMSVETKHDISGFTKPKCESVMVSARRAVNSAPFPMLTYGCH